MFGTFRARTNNRSQATQGLGHPEIAGVGGRKLCGAAAIFMRANSAGKTRKSDLRKIRYQPAAEVVI